MRKNIFKTLAIAFFTTFSFGKIKAGDDCTIMRTIPYLQTPTQNSMVVRWVTSLDCLGTVEYSTDSAKVANGTATKANETTKTLTHRIKLNNLSVGTKYYYRVCSKIPPCNSQSTGSQHYSDVYSFTTLKNGNHDFKILIFNDLHPYLYKPVGYLPDSLQVKVSPIIDTLKYDLIVFNGDCFDGFDKEEDIVYWLDRFSKFTKSNYVPSIYVAGNHEYDGKQADIENQYDSMTLKKYIEFVHDGISYGITKLGGIQLLFIDTGQSNNDNKPYFDEEYYPSQKSYINASLIKSEKTILIHHIPFFGECMSGFQQNLHSKIIGNTLDGANIVLAINGHTHQLETINKGRYQNNYPVYVGEGPGTTGVCNSKSYGFILSMTVLIKKGNNFSLIAYIMKNDYSLISKSYTINNNGTFSELIN
jgi:Icc-related predicted phosphoesterase